MTARELGILYKPDMHLAIREGRKTQTRRIIKQAIGAEDVWGGEKDGLWSVHRFGDPCHSQIKPRYRVGDLLYVKEAYASPSKYIVAYKLGAQCGAWKSPLHMPKWAARTWMEVTGVRAERLQDISEADAIAEGVAPLFSAQERASRPEYDVDGYRNYLWHGWVGKTITAKQSDAWVHQYSSYDTARGSYSSLWESINGPGSWAANPWVWVYEFRRIER